MNVCVDMKNVILVINVTTKIKNVKLQLVHKIQKKMFWIPNASVTQTSVIQLNIAILQLISVNNNFVLIQIPNKF